MFGENRSLWNLDAMLEKIRQGIPLLNTMIGYARDAETPSRRRVAKKKVQEMVNLLTDLCGLWWCALEDIQDSSLWWVKHRSGKQVCTVTGMLIKH
jgi:nicotinamide mononucleotide adenylyltransferase